MLDCGNGAAFRTAPKVFKELGAEIEVINAWPDGMNINKDCGSTDPSGLREAVVASGAVAGLALDGDGDRVIAVDERGGVIDGDQMLAIFALDMKERDALRGNAVVATVMSNLGLRRCLASHDIEFVETPVGDRFVVDELQQRNLPARRRAVGSHRLHRLRDDGRRHAHRRAPPRRHSTAPATRCRSSPA